MIAEDLLQVVAIERASNLSEWGYEGYEMELTNPDALVCVSVETANDKVKIVTDELSGQIASGARVYGFLAARFVYDELHITNIAVLPGLRRRGIGDSLLSEAVEAGRRRAGCAWLVLEVRESNLAAQKFYANANFEVVGRRKNYYHAPAEDALLMARQL